MSREQEVGGWAGLEDCQVMEVRQAEQALRRCDNLCGEGGDYPCRSPAPAEGVGGTPLFVMLFSHLGLPVRNGPVENWPAILLVILEGYKKSHSEER